MALSILSFFHIKDRGSHPLDLSLITFSEPSEGHSGQTRWALVRTEGEHISFISSPSYGENDLSKDDIESNLHDPKAYLMNSRVIAMMSIKPPNFGDV